MGLNLPKPVAPVFTSYKPLIGFLNGFRDDGHIPLRVDKSHLPKASGSVVHGHLHALKYLKITDEAGKPLPNFEKFVMASDTDRPAILAEMLKDSYAWLFSDPEFDLARTSSKQLEEKFRTQAINGSTVIRAVSFFLLAAKDAGLKTAPGLKAPTAPARPSTVKKPALPNGKRDMPAGEEEIEEGDEDPGSGGVMKFEIPIPVDRKVRISIPADFDEADWELLQTMFTAYVKRWKGFATKKEGGT